VWPSLRVVEGEQNKSSHCGMDLRRHRVAIFVKPKSEDSEMRMNWEVAGGAQPFRQRWTSRINVGETGVQSAKHDAPSEFRAGLREEGTFQKDKSKISSRTATVIIKERGSQGLLKIRS